jgi:hypothetical protein
VKSEIAATRASGGQPQGIEFMKDFSVDGVFDAALTALGVFLAS